MPERTAQTPIALAGLLGVLILGLYFAAPFPQPPADATAAQVADAATRYHAFVLLGGWLQIVGTILAATFFVGLAYLAGAAARLGGMLTVLASAVLVSTSLLEATLLMDVAYAVSNGHPQTALSDWDLMTMFIHVFPIGPAPLAFFALGLVLLGSSLLPRVFAYLALALAAAFFVVGFVGLFVPAASVAIIALLIGQELWIAAVAVKLLMDARRDGRRAPTAGAA